MTADRIEAHGLTRAPAAPAWPRIGEEAGALLATCYPQLETPYALDWHAPRPFAATARVRTGSGTVFVKRHHPRLRSAADLLAEHRFAAHLAPRLAPTAIACALPAADGATARAFGGWVWEVLPEMPGLDRHRDTLSWEPATDAREAYACGAALARLHQAAEGFDAPPRQAPWLVGRLAPLDAADPLAALIGALDADPDLRAALSPWPDWRRRCSEVLAPPLARLATWPRAAPLWTHGDWHVSNLLWSADGARVASVLDLGLCDRTCAMFDLATAIERNCVAWLALADGACIGRPALARALIDGYHGVLPLDLAARGYLAAMLPVVHLGFAVSEIGYFHALRGEQEAVALAFETFLLGHAAWFDGEDGHALLSALAA